MNKFAIFFLVSLFGTVSAVAQDDMYFVPSDTPEEVVIEYQETPSATYYSGSDRDVDEYNRRGSYFQEIDSAGNDIIDFDGEVGVYPDSTEDYSCTRAMSRFDGYSWWDPYWAGYVDGRYDDWWWRNPWYYSSWYYYNPWFYGGWHGSWWYYSWYPHYHYYWPTVSYYRTYHGVTGTRNHGYVRRGGSYGNRNSFRGYRSNVNTTTRRDNTMRNFNGNRSANRMNTTTVRPSFQSSGSFGGARSGGSFSGGSRGGSFGGGSRGGSFGGRR